MALKSFVLAALIAVGSAGTSLEDVDFDIMEYLENDNSARLMKNKDPVVASSVYHEEDPIVVEHVEGQRAAHVVKSKGPVTKKVVANGSHSQYCAEGEAPGCEADFSLILWKFADQDVRGKIENKLKSGDIVKVDVDCLNLAGDAAIVGGTVTKADGRADNLRDTRAYVMVVDGGDGDDARDFISGLSAGWSDDTDCGSHDLDEFRKGNSLEMRGSYVKLCNRRDGEDAWIECVRSVKSVA